LLCPTVPTGKENKHRLKGVIFPSERREKKSPIEYDPQMKVSWFNSYKYAPATAFSLHGGSAFRVQRWPTKIRRKGGSRPRAKIGPYVGGGDSSSLGVRVQRMGAFTPEGEEESEQKTTTLTNPLPTQ